MWSSKISDIIVDYYTKYYVNNERKIFEPNIKKLIDENNDFIIGGNIGLHHLLNKPIEPSDNYIIFCNKFVETARAIADNFYKETKSILVSTQTSIPYKEISILCGQRVIATVYSNFTTNRSFIKKNITLLNGDEVNVRIISPRLYIISLLRDYYDPLCIEDRQKNRITIISIKKFMDSQNPKIPLVEEDTKSKNNRNNKRKHKYNNHLNIINELDDNDDKKYGDDEKLKGGETELSTKTTKHISNELLNKINIGEFKNYLINKLLVYCNNNKVILIGDKNIDNESIELAKLIGEVPTIHEMHVPGDMFMHKVTGYINKPNSKNKKNITKLVGIVNLQISVYNIGYYDLFPYYQYNNGVKVAIPSIVSRICMVEDNSGFDLLHNNKIKFYNPIMQNNFYESALSEVYPPAKQIYGNYCDKLTLKKHMINNVENKIMPYYPYLNELYNTT